MFFGYFKTAARRLEASWHRDKLTWAGSGTTGHWLRPAMETVVSLAVLSLSIYLLLSDSDAATRQFATGSLGTVTGYWLRPPDNGEVSREDPDVSGNMESPKRSR